MGFSLLEVTLALPLTVLVVMGAIAIWLAGVRMWRAQAELADVQERAMFAMTQLKRAVRMAGYRNWDVYEGFDGKGHDKGNLQWDPLRVSANCAVNIDNCARGWQESDLIEIQFHGAGDPPGRQTVEDGVIENCAGKREVGPKWERDLVRIRYFVNAGEDGIPSLYCRYLNRDKGASTWAPSQALVRGVEAMYIRVGYRSTPTSSIRWYPPERGTRRNPVKPPRAGGSWEHAAAVAFSLVMRGGARPRGNPAGTQQVYVFDESTGGRRSVWMERSGAHRLHVFNLFAVRRNDGGLGDKGRIWLAPS